jgi:hypothetical protein
MVGCVINFGPTCKACGKGYIMVDNKCIRIIEGCEQYNAIGSCVKCIANSAILGDCEYRYQLFNGICLKTKSKTQELVNYFTRCKVKNAYGCVICENDYYLDSNRKCIPYEPGCLVYFNGRCQECSTFRGYVMDQSGKCVSNVQNVANCV